MMGDTNVETVMRHYFNLDIEFMTEMVSCWLVLEHYPMLAVWNQTS
jgi:hypothetical protein